MWRGVFFVMAVIGPALLSIGTVPAAENVHHHVHLSLNPENGDVTIRDRFTVQADHTLSFGLAPWLTLINAQVDGKEVEAARVGDHIFMPIAGSGSREIEISLKGVLPELQNGGEQAQSLGAVAGEEGVYLPGYAGWLPDIGSNWVRYDLTIDVPTPYRVVATGRLVEEQDDGDIFRAVFASEAPTEFPSVFVGPYVIGESIEGDFRIRTYFHPELAPLAEDYRATAADYIDRYAEQIGDYPYADFHIVSAPLPVGLGFPNLTYVGRRVLPLPFMRGRSLAHEVLHNWWGNGVAVEYRDGNWAEGLTTYQADYVLAEEESEDAARMMRLGWLQNFAALPSERDMPVVRFVAKQHDAAQVVGYGKVAFLFHMLKSELGDQAFRAGLQRFWSDHRFQTASWSDLRAAFETETARDLGWFFEQWLFRTGAPSIELVDARWEAVDGGYRVDLKIRQSDPHYRLRLPVTIETRDGIVADDVVLDQAEQRFELMTEARPLAVHLDPEFHAFRALLPGESPPIFRDVTLSSDTVLLLPTQDPHLADVARQLAGRLLQRDPAIGDGDKEDLKDAPVVVIGLADDVSTVRAQMGPFSRATEAAERLADIGTASAWAERRFDGQPWLFVAAEDAAALEAVLRPLPHYRSRSFVVFDGAKAVDRGLWRAQDSPLSHRFAD